VFSAVSKTVNRASGSEVQILSPPLNQAGRRAKALRFSRLLRLL
jgi:hypothetical protein